MSSPVGKWLWPVVVVALSVVVFCWLCVNPVKSRANEAYDLAHKIHVYLGTNSDPMTLVGYLDEAAKFHREQYEKIECRLWKLEHPGETLPDPSVCPPEGPSSRPPPPPAYP